MPRVTLSQLRDHHLTEGFMYSLQRLLGEWERARKFLHEDQKHSKRHVAGEKGGHRINLGSLYNTQILQP
jgi:hypothetical protein